MFDNFLITLESGMDRGGCYLARLELENELKAGNNRVASKMGVGDEKPLLQIF